jgi:transposase
VNEVERARELLEAEQKAVLAILGVAGKEAREAARRQKVWRNTVSDQLERGRAAGVSVTEMANALGLSRQWTSHLLARREARQKDRVLSRVHEEFEFVRRGSSLVQQRRPKGGAA